MIQRWVSKMKNVNVKKFEENALVAGEKGTHALIQRGNRGVSNEIQSISGRKIESIRRASMGEFPQEKKEKKRLTMVVAQNMVTPILTGLATEDQKNQSAFAAQMESAGYEGAKSIIQLLEVGLKVQIRKTNLHQEISIMTLTVQPNRPISLNNCFHPLKEWAALFQMNLGKKQVEQICFPVETGFGKDLFIDESPIIQPGLEKVNSRMIRPNEEGSVRRRSQRLKKKDKDHYITAHEKAKQMCYPDQVSPFHAKRRPKVPIKLNMEARTDPLDEEFTLKMVEAMGLCAEEETKQKFKKIILMEVLQADAIGTSNRSDNGLHEEN